MGQVERIVLGMVLSVLSASVLAQSKTGSVYSCTDAQGRKLTADRPIAECADREQRVIGPTGTERPRLQPRLSENEAAARESQRRQQAQEQQRQQETRRREQALLARYPKPSMHDSDRQAALVPVDESLAATRRRIADVQASRHKLDQEMEFYQRDPSKAPTSLRRAMADNEQELGGQLRMLDAGLQERQRVEQRFEDERNVLRRLWDEAAEEAKAAKAGN